MLEKSWLQQEHQFLYSTQSMADMLLSKGAFEKSRRPMIESIKVQCLIRYPRKFGEEFPSNQNPINTPDILPLRFFGLMDFQF